MATSITTCSTVLGVDASMRDKEMERLAVEAMLHYFPRPSGAVAAIPESDDEAIYRLLTEGLAVLRGLGDVMATPAFDGLTAMPRPTISIGLSVKSGLVEISPIADEIDPDDVPGLLAATVGAADSTGCATAPSSTCATWICPTSTRSRMTWDCGCRSGIRLDHGARL